MKNTSSLLLALSSFLLYSSMTCVHIPMKYQGPGEWNRQVVLAQSRVVLVEPQREDSKVSENKGVGSRFSNIATGQSSEDSRMESKNNKRDVPNADSESVNLLPKRPSYTRGIYLTVNTAGSLKKLESFIRQAKAYDINTFVIDVQPRMIPKTHIQKILEAGIFPVARIVVFESGLKQLKPSKSHTQKILRTIADSAAQGFLEAQLDYIRYADYPRLQRLPLKTKYGVINGFLAEAEQVARAEGIYLSADVFGRITLNQHDHIGQKLENFGKHLHVIYPMVYPSHYTNDPKRINDPYSTVKEGVRNSKDRLTRTRVVAYIQGFDMKRKGTGLSMVSYIAAQMRACEDAGGDGWVIWNPRNQYKPSYQAIYSLSREKARKLAEAQSDNKTPKTDSDG